jgi:hypothetical protein
MPLLAPVMTMTWHLRLVGWTDTKLLVAVTD